MLKATLRLQDGREISVLIRERMYRKLTAKLSNLTFLERLKLLFFGKEK